MDKTRFRLAESGWEQSHQIRETEARRRLFRDPTAVGKGLSSRDDVRMRRQLCGLGADVSHLVSLPDSFPPCFLF